MSGLTLEGLDLLARIPAERRLEAFRRNLREMSLLDMLIVAGPPPLAGGAEIFPDEWLDHKLGQEPRNDLANFPLPSTIHMGLFRAQTATTVPPRNTQLGATAPAAVDEPSGGGYTRIAMSSLVWGTQASITTTPTGRRLTALQQSFPESSAAWAPPTIKGFFLSNAAFGVAGKAIYYSNFDNGEAIDANAAGYLIRATPFYEVVG